MQSLGRAIPLRRDPAPSRLTYRLQRLWLTPLFRAGMRIGLPVFLVVLVGGVYLSDTVRRENLGASFTAMRDSVAERPIFMVKLLSITGASPELADAVRARLNVKLPQSSLDLDLDAIREAAQRLDAVQSAVVRLGASNVLELQITERTPAWVWRSDAGLMMLDASGHRIAGLSERNDRADLPLVAGEGADQAISEAAAIVAAAPWAKRIRGLIRLSDRRWDIVLDRNQRILLPAHDPVSAVQALATLDHAEDILSRDLSAVDMRNPDRPVLRLTPYALEALRTQATDPEPQQ